MITYRIATPPKALEAGVYYYILGSSRNPNIRQNLLRLNLSAPNNSYTPPICWPSSHNNTGHRSGSTVVRRAVQQNRYPFFLFSQQKMSTKYLPSSSSSSEEMLTPPKMSPEQESALDMHFSRNKTMHPSDVAILSAETGLSEEQVQVDIQERLQL